MKNFQKPVLLIAVVFLFVSIFTGCGSDNGSAGTAENTSRAAVTDSESTAAVTEAGLPKNGIKFEPEVEITTACILGDVIKFKNGETIQDNVHTRWAKDTLGINIRYLWTTPETNDAFRTKLMLSLSANEPLPDFLNVGMDIAQDLIDSGRFQAVDGMFEQYACPEWKEAMAEVPNAWLPYLRDGKKYAIPELEYSMQHDDVMWMRKDWLEKLGLSAPKTIAELEAVMDAFVNRDPDGNSKKDTYGLTSTMLLNYNAWIGPGAVFGSFGAIPQKWQKNEKGEIVYGSVRPEIKTALGKFKEWIDKGYVHKEIGMHDEMKASELFTSGKAGIAFGASWLYGWPLNATEVNVPGAVVWPYPLPAGPDGKIGQASEGSHYFVMLFNKDFKNPEIFFQYYNYLYQNYMLPEEGGVFENGFAKGYDYDIVDGKVVLTEDQIPGGRVAPEKYFLAVAPRMPSLYMNTLAQLANGKAPETLFEKKVVTVGLQQPLEAAKIVVDQRAHTIDDLFTGKPTDTMKDKLADLKTMEIEAFSKIIYGKAGSDEFDRFVADWYAKGGQQITDEVREWYKSVGGK